VPGPLNEEQRQCLEDILTAGRHLLKLVNEVLDISRIESGKTELRLTYLALNDVVKWLRKTMAPILKPRKQSLEVVMEKGLPSVYADESKLRQVLLNLVSNAAKSSPDGSRIRVEAVRKGDWCQVSVINSGTGIREEDQKRIFEPFYRVETPSTKEEQGTGLGLAVVKQIIEKHGGQVWVESEYGKGTTFRFTLPIDTGASESATD